MSLEQTQKTQQTEHAPEALYAPDRARMEPIGAGVYAFVQPDGGWCLSNAGLVTATETARPAEQILLIDTAATWARAQRLRAEAVRVAGRAPTLVVNTHFHGDHVFGNCVFAPEATIIGQRAVREQILESGLSLTQLWPQVEWGRISVVAPQVTFEQESTVWVGGTEVRLIHVPAAHTPDDVVVWLPQQRILFTGDIAMSGVTPFCLMGSIEGCLEAVTRLEELRPLTVVPGHGPVGGPEVLSATRHYLTWLAQSAREGLAAGRNPLEQATHAVLGEFAGLIDPERLVANLHRAYAELGGLARGQRVDIQGPFVDMVTWNGGLPDCHA